MARHFRLGAALAITALSFGTAQAQTLTVETATASGMTTLAMQVIATYGGVDLQINSGQTLTRSCLKLGREEIAMAICPPPVISMMQRGVGPYASDAEGAMTSAQSLRALFGFTGGLIHGIVHTEGGIESWDDLYGRRVFTGPPAGAANNQVQTIIRAASGLIAGEDYEAVQMDWSAALQGFQDSQFDAFFSPTAVGNAALEQLGAITLLSIPDNALDSEGWQDWLAIGGTGLGTIPAGTYSNAANTEAVKAGEFFQMATVNTTMDEDTAYALTKAFWENLPAAANDIRVLRAVNAEMPLSGLNLPLHPGAIRYYEETGVAIPDDLR
ncbi:MAG: TAXI family TRAP transporter solute-binding subunit [Qingshengfaniella sp.]